jgi:hypothetical protein
VGAGRNTHDHRVFGSVLTILALQDEKKKQTRGNPPCSRISQVCFLFIATLRKAKAGAGQNPAGKDGARGSHLHHVCLPHRNCLFGGGLQRSEGDCKHFDQRIPSFPAPEPSKGRKLTIRSFVPNISDY